ALQLPDNSPTVVLLSRVNKNVNNVIAAVTDTAALYPVYSAFGGVLNAYELMKAMIQAGAAAVHFEDQLAAVKKCGHMGGK
ncbi:hypothetical protein, partial [Pantoea agglomerans]|uniref:hypothetical protein n=1 Tax=Enterobacter agglomerans TaxID=549 RepID=UPI001F5D288E